MTDDDGTVALRLVVDPWGLGERPLPCGSYEVRLDGREVSLGCAGRASRRPAPTRRTRRPPRHRAAGARRPPRPRRGGSARPASPPAGVRRRHRTGRPGARVLPVLHGPVADRQPAGDPREPAPAATRRPRPLVRRRPGCAGARGRRAGADPQPGVVRHARPRPLGRHQHRDGALVPAPPGAAAPADLARQPRQGDGAGPLARQRADPGPDRAEPRPRPAQLDPADEPEPGDDRALPPRVRVRRSGGRPGIRPRRRTALALRRPGARGLAQAPRHRRGPDGRALRPHLARHDGDELPGGPAPGRPRPRPAWPTHSDRRTSCCCVATASTPGMPGGRVARGSSTSRTTRRSTT